MKNKKTIIAALIMIVSGAVLLGIGLASGGKTSLVWREGRPQISQPISTQQSFASDDVKNMIINSKDADLEIITGSTLKVESHLLDQKPEINLQGQTLNVEVRKSAFDFNLGLNFGKMGQEKIIVTVPENMNFEKIIIDGTSGQKTLRDLKAESLKINLRDGGLSLERVKGNQLTMNISDAAWQLRDLTLSGHLKVTSNDGASVLERVTAESMDFASNDGATVFENLRLKEHSKIIKKDGQLKMINSQLPGINAEAEELYVNHVKKEFPYQTGNQETALTVKVTDGSFYLINE
ncbi:DUF4097 family beta strand repeat-containing protein [Lactococcus formosensis]|uniref:DUF4097 family beta strand repeat-containing protein n=1 Tax=Lactococcus formosensis TaxID=1281486 RepID=UPI00254FB05E|nr:DUF4097 family beta strand repeat-containing protein [Lactococcus formosensis]